MICLHLARVSCINIHSMQFAQWEGVSACVPIRKQSVHVPDLLRPARSNRVKHTERTCRPQHKSVTGTGRADG